MREGNLFRWILRNFWTQAVLRRGARARLAVLLAGGILALPLWAGWTPTGAPVREKVNSIAYGYIDSSNYVCFAGLSDYGVYYSTSSDGGQTWGQYQKTGLDEFALAGAAVTSVATSLGFQSDHLVVAGTSDGRVFRSTDLSGNWQSWTPSTGLPSSGNKINQLAICDTVYACTNLGLYISTNNGASFIAFSPAVPGSGIVTGIAVSDMCYTPLYWVCTNEDGGTSGGIYRYNGGDHWTPLPLPPPINPPGLYAFNCIDVPHATSITPEYIWAGDDNHNGLLESTDGGANWNTPYLSCEPIRCIQHAPDYTALHNPHFAFGTDAGWYDAVAAVAPLGASYTQQFPKGLGVNQLVPSPAWSPSNELWLAATDDGFVEVSLGIYASYYDDGLTLFDVSTLAPSPSVSSDHTVFIASRRLGVFRSIDSGTSFQPYMPSLQDATGAASLPAPITDVALPPTFNGGGTCGTDQTQTTVYMATGGLGVYQSTNTGSSWDSMSNGLSTTNQNISALVCTPTTMPAPLFAGSSSGTFLRYNGVAASWEPTATSPFTGPVTCIGMPPNYGNSYPFLFVGSGSNLYQFNNIGGSGSGSWSSDDLPGTGSVTAVVFHPAYNGSANQTMFAARKGSGVFEKVFTSGSWSWSPETSEMGNLNVTALAISPNFAVDHIVVAGTDDPNLPNAGGVYYSSDGGATWTLKNGTDYPLPDVHIRSLRVIALSGGGTRILCGVHKNQLFYTDNPTAQNPTWIQSTGFGSASGAGNAVFMSPMPTDTVCPPMNPNGPGTDVFIAGPQGVFWSNDGGETYRPINLWANSTTLCPPQVNCLYSYIYSNGCPLAVKDRAETGLRTPVLVAGTQGQGIWYRCAHQDQSSNGWDWTAGNWQQSNLTAGTINRFTRDRLAMIVAVGDGGAWESADGGVTWESQSSGLPGGSALHDVRFGQTPGLSESAPGPKSPSGNTIWGTVDNSGVYRGSSTSESTQSTLGVTWVEANGQGAGRLSNLDARSVIQLSDPATTLLCGTGSPGQVYRSGDQGATWWEASGAGLESLSSCGSITDFLEACNSDVLLTASGSGTCGGVFLSGDTGRHWVKISSDLPNGDFSSIIADSGCPPTYYAGAYAHGAYATTLTGINYPSVSGIVGTSGLSTGGTTVTISGSNFKCSCPIGYGGCNGQSQAVAVFGDADAVTTSCGSATLQVTTPPHPSGAVTVAVRNPDTRAAYWTGTFTYTEVEGGGSPFNITLSRASGHVTVHWENAPTASPFIYRSTKPNFSDPLLYATGSGTSGDWTDASLSGQDSFLYFYKVE